MYLNGDQTRQINLFVRDNKPTKKKLRKQKRENNRSQRAWITYTFKAVIVAGV